METRSRGCTCTGGLLPQTVCHGTSGCVSSRKAFLISAQGVTMTATARQLRANHCAGSADCMQLRLLPTPEWAAWSLNIADQSSTQVLSDSSDPPANDSTAVGFGAGVLASDPTWVRRGRDHDRPVKRLTC